MSKDGSYKAPKFTPPPPSAPKAPSVSWPPPNIGPSKGPSPGGKK
jgi:hypothetical protein